MGASYVHTFIGHVRGRMGPSQPANVMEKSYLSGRWRVDWENRSARQWKIPKGFFFSVAGSSGMWWVGGAATRDNTGPERAGNTYCEGTAAVGGVDAWK